jgi:hypothetical protein
MNDHKDFSRTLRYCCASACGSKEEIFFCLPGTYSSSRHAGTRKRTGLLSGRPWRDWFAGKYLQDRHGFLYWLNYGCQEL